MEWRRRRGSGGAAAEVKVRAHIVTVLLFLLPVLLSSTPPPLLPPPRVQCGPTADCCHSRRPWQVVNAAAAASPLPDVQCERDIPQPLTASTTTVPGESSLTTPPPLPPPPCIQCKKDVLPMLIAAVAAVPGPRSPPSSTGRRATCSSPHPPSPPPGLREVAHEFGGRIPHSGGDRDSGGVGIGWVARLGLILGGTLCYNFLSFWY